MNGTAPISTDHTIIPYRGTHPTIHPSAFIAAGARVVGDVTIGENSSIWFNVVVRGDVEPVVIGAGTNIQDLTTCHVTNGQFSLWIGDDVTVGHRAILHGARIEEGALIGMGAIVLDGATIGAEAIVAAGAVVPPGMTVPPGTLVAGVPAKIIRDLSEQERRAGREGAEHYRGYAKEYREGMNSQ